MALCERFGKLPSELYAEESDLWRLLAIEEMGGGVDDERS